MTVWLDGRIVEAESAISAEDRGFLIGDGVFETIRTEGGAPLFLEPHLARLAVGLAALGIEAEIDPPLVRRACRDLAATKGVAGAGALRITVSRGKGGRGPGRARGVAPTRLISLEGIEAPPAALTAILARQRRFSGAAAARFKSIGGYADNLAARAEAEAAGAGEALMLNEHGRLAGASAANVFLISEGGEVATPPVGEGALPGVVRGLLLEGARGHGVGIAERPAPAAEIATSALFLTNSLRGLARLEGDWSGPALEAFARLETWYQSRLVAECAAAGSGR